MKTNKTLPRSGKNMSELGNVLKKLQLEEDFGRILNEFYNKEANADRLKLIGINDVDKFISIMNPAIRRDIKNKYIFFDGNTFYSTVSAADGSKITGSKIDYLEDFLRSGGIMQLKLLDEVWLEVTKDDEKILEEIGMTKSDFIDIMKTTISNNSVIAFRPISEYAKYLLESGAMGKLFKTEGKSSVIGPLKGIVPYLSWFSKVSKKIDDVNTIDKNASNVNSFQKKNDQDINKSTLIFYTMILEALLNYDTTLDKKGKKTGKIKIDSISLNLKADIENDPKDFSKAILRNIAQYCKEQHLEDVFDIIKNHNDDEDEVKTSLLNFVLNKIEKSNDKKILFINLIN